MEIYAHQIILMTECSKVCILDFDWADRVRQAHYPHDINMDERCGWHANVTPGGVIEIEHDQYQITKIVHITTLNSKQ